MRLMILAVLTAFLAVVTFPVARRFHAGVTLQRSVRRTEGRSTLGNACVISETATD